MTKVTLSATISRVLGSNEAHIKYMNGAHTYTLPVDLPDAEPGPCQMIIQYTSNIDDGKLIETPSDSFLTSP